MRKLYLCFVSVFLSFALWAEGTDYTRGLSIWFDTPNSLDGRAIWLRADGSGMNPDREWENASLPIGNVSLGANILGSVAAERITLNEKTLWKGGPNTAGGADYYWKVNKQSASVMEEIRQAFTDGDYKKAELLTRKNFNGLAHYEEGDETPFRFGSFTTMGEIYVETGLSEIGMSDYYRALSLDSAMAVVSFKKDNTRYMRKYFISYPDSVMAMKFTANKTGKQNLVLRYCPNSEAKSSLCADDTDGLLYTGVLENNGMKFAIRIKAITKGGTTTVEQDRLIVKDADEVVFLLTADTDYKMNFQPDFKDPKTYVGSDPEQTTRKTMEGAIRKGYDELYRAHEADYTSLFNRVKLQLNPEVTARNLPTNLRLANYRKGQADYRLEELYYQYGRYLLIACSRPGNMPANLQGIWHNNLNGPWLATHIWEYYDYTRDKEFLKSTGYDLLKSSAQFTVDYLWHKPDGTYTAAPSTSPEHGPVDEGTTFVHAVVREILLNAIEASKVLGVDKKERKEWEYVLAHLAPYKIGRYGQLMEWSRDIDDPEDEHRHVNHLFGLHPGHTLSPVTTPELAQAARVVLEHRGDGATGWSMGWKLNQWARLQDGNHAYKLYGNLLKNGTLDNLWDTHAPFQIDGNFGGTAGITEMLLQSHMGFIQLLPALPDAWQDGSVSGICARGGFEVNLSWKDGKLAEAVVTSEKGVPCTVRYEDKTLSFKTKKGSSYRIVMDNNELKKKIIE